MPKPEIQMLQQISSMAQGIMDVNYENIAVF
jgi:hypothetical protein